MDNYNNQPQYLYQLKNSLVTETERKYLSAICQVTPQGYTVQAQVNLASIIEKTDNSKFQNELYRNIDACIFDTYFRPIALIEINDSTHNNPSRIERDKKIAMICEEAGIPLIRFWTKYGVNYEYMRKKIAEAIEKSNNPIRISHFKKEPQPQQVIQETSMGYTRPASNKKSGCYIATSIYGSYDCPEVWTLRRFRDQTLAKTWYGRLFIKVYYAISPTLVKHFGETRAFTSFFKPKLDRIVERLQNKGFESTKYYS